MKLIVFPATLKQANDLVAALHRHHKPARGHRFSLGVRGPDGTIHGAAIVGRPVARGCPQYDWAEVTRLVTDGTHNACSKLYSAAARACKEMGFALIQTYILESETGASLTAAGWTRDHLTDGGDWNCPSRGGRRTDQPQERKGRWFKMLTPPAEHA
jgi:hypothetical protein